MDKKTLHKLVKRLSVGRIDAGEQAAARRRILDDLYSAGIPTDEATSLGEDDLSSMPGHTLLAWGHEDGETAVHFFVIPDDAIDEPMRTWLDAVDGLRFATPYDCSLFQYGAALRVLAATGLAERDPESFYAAHVAPVWDEMAGDRDLRELPSPEDIAALSGRLARHHVGRDSLPAEALDRRFTHAIAVEQRD